NTSALTRVGCVDQVPWNVSVPHQVAVVTRAAAAILDRIFLAVVLNAMEIRDVARPDLEVAAVQLTKEGDLPPADYGILRAAGVGAESLALAERQAVDAVPVEPV